MNPRAAITLLLVIGTGILSLSDPKLKEVFGDLAKVAVGGYLGQLMPETTP